MKANESIKRFQTEEGFVFTEQELQSHIETQDELNDLKTKLALYEQEIRLNKSLHEQELKNKELLLQEKEGRIIDLQKTILLLEAPKKEPELNQADQIPEKKKRWWQF